MSSTGIQGKSIGNYDGYLWGRNDFSAGKSVGKQKGYATLDEALKVAKDVPGAEVVSKSDGKYYLNEVRGTHYSKESGAEVTVRANSTVISNEGNAHSVVGFVDDSNNLISQYDDDENLELVGKLNEVRQILKALPSDMPDKDKMEFLGDALDINSPKHMAKTDKIMAALKKMPKYLPDSLKHKFDAMLKPENLAILAGTLAVWAGSHAFGVGEVVDVVLLGVGLGFLGAEAIDVGKDFYNFAKIAINADSESDFEEAGARLANGISTALVDTAAILLTKKAMSSSGGIKIDVTPSRVLATPGGQTFTTAPAISVSASPVAVSTGTATIGVVPGALAGENVYYAKSHKSGGGGSANKATFQNEKFSSAEITGKATKKIKDQTLMKKFQAALKKGKVAPTGNSGIKGLNPPVGKYTHELKVGGSGARVLGYIDDAGALVLDKFMQNGLH